MRRLLPALTAAFALCFAPAALAATYDVVGTGDISDPPPCTPIVPGVAFQCPTLRSAVFASDASAEDDSITIHGGTYTLSSGTLSLNDTVTIIGEGARASIIQSNGSSRLLTIAASVDATIANVTLQGGAAGLGNGGNVLVGTGGQLGLVFARVTGGTAANGAGIANLGDVTVANSLIDGNIATNAGGGIYNSSGTLTVGNATLANNQATETGGGIRSEGTGGSVALFFATIGRNTSGVSATGPQNIDAQYSIIASNATGNCNGVSIGEGQFNVEDGTSCGFTSPGDPGLAGSLSNQGGPTDVLTIAKPGPAAGYAPQCFGGADQRGYTRPAAPSPCDVGAYDTAGIAPGGGEQPPVPTPTPTPTPPAPTPTPTPTPTETPVPNKTVAVEPEGTVLIKRNGKFVPLGDDVVPNGAEIDTKKGEVTITTAQGDEAKFFDGIFKVSQKGGVTTLTLSEALDCKKPKGGKATASAKKPKSRKLWGDGKGKFRTKGSYSAATVRGTKWLVQDTCTTTTTKVTQGVVQVEDFVTKKKINVRKNKTYVARAKR